MIAVKVISDQGITVQGVTFETPFFGAAKAQAAAARIGLSLRVINFTEEHLTMLKNPRYGYGKNMNPCIDCHTLMLKRTGMLMAEMNAAFIFTGEVLGQRPMSQGKQSLHVVAKHSGYQDFILRPLSARLLPETLPEREGKVDRQRLLDIQGRGRKTQMALAALYGISDYAPPAGGCLLTDPMFTKRLRDLFLHQKDPPIRDIELLKHGRHFRVDERIKIIVGRNSSDNDALQDWRQPQDAYFEMRNMAGPSVLIPGGADADGLQAAARLCVLYSSVPDARYAEVLSTQADKTAVLSVKALERETAEGWII